MAHTIWVADSPMAVRGVVDLGGDGAQPRLRFQTLANGDLVVIAPQGGRIDGRVMLGGLAVVEWGVGAIVRAHERVEVRWNAAREVRTAAATRRCALCYGPIAAGEAMSVCACEATVHPECHEVMISCSSCGEAA
jgi:hypothetical protein